MGMVVQHNMNAINAYNRLNANVAGLKKASEKLSSGYRINRAGDDAAGLAVSEKMRSQIKGLNQAIRNSQDGINMIQTFEGAAQESHSILQRMKELATQSANGTYDNATDRAAMQLEFDQLNDELNQIADTDFNGTVVLNGGIMADGTRATDGVFNYKTSITDAEIAANATDISGGAQKDTIADQSFYAKAEADAVWNATGVDLNKYGSIQVTFMFDGDHWNATTVNDGNDNIIDGAKASGLTAKSVDRDAATGKGGFEVYAGGTKVTNAIFNEMNVKEGDTVTLSFTNKKAGTYAPDNIGLDEDYDKKTPFKIEPKDADTDLGLNLGALNKTVSVKLDSSVNDANMNATLKKALTTLDNADFKVTYEKGAVKTVAVSGADDAPTEGVDFDKLTVEMSGTTGTIKWDKEGANLTLGTITMKTLEANNPAQPATATAAVATEDTAGNTTIAANKVDKTTVAGLLADSTVDATLTLKCTNNAGDGTWSITGSKDDTQTYTNAQLADLIGTGAITVGGNVAKDDEITVTYTAPVPAQKGGDTTANGDVTFSINVDSFNLTDLSDLSVHAVETPGNATMAAQVGAVGVSKADSFDQSTGILTYTDNITLQTGARTKDSVNFSFAYNKDGTADMGELKPNLDLSSRANGLNTANLSLATAKDANLAIDQIDKAINKVSMVRATFGSIQNRLDHKITNLTTTSENLTEAESAIRDTDMASEMMNYTKFNILQQAAQSMLAQANQQPQSILQLLG